MLNTVGLCYGVYTSYDEHYENNVEDGASANKIVFSASCIELGVLFYTFFNFMYFSVRLKCTDMSEDFQVAPTHSLCHPCTHFSTHILTLSGPKRSSTNSG